MKRITFRFKDDEIYKEFMTKIKFKDNSSFQEFVEMAIENYLSGNYKPNKEENEMQYQGETFTINLTSGELKQTGEIGEDIYDWMVEKLERWANKETNDTTYSDVDSFKKGDWIVEITVREGGLGYNAGRTQQEIVNQPEWGEDSWKDIGLGEFKEEFELYFKEVI